MTLELDVRMDGCEDPIAVLKRHESGVEFQYVENYQGKALSLSLQHTENNFSSVSSGSFFENLVQENGSLDHIMSRKKIDPNDIVGLLSHIGRDCTGAISILPQGSPAVKIPGNFETDYERLKEQNIIDLVRCFRNYQSFPKAFNTPSPIAGVQNKLALTILPDGSFAQPVEGSGAPTTHILKISNRTRVNETILEEQVMRMSKKFGIRTAEVENREIGGVNTLLVTRFDREIDKAGDVVRIHQEDLTQALNLPPRMKYELYGEENARFDVKAISCIINHPNATSGMREEFITATVFDLMVGNNDGHGKNFSLLYKEDGKFEFTPRYDLVPTQMFPNITDELPYYIGNAETLEQITVDDFNIFLSILGIEDPSEQKQIRNKIVLDLGHKFAGELDDLQKDFADSIICNARSLFWKFGLDSDMPKDFEKVINRNYPVYETISSRKKPTLMF